MRSVAKTEIGLIEMPESGRIGLPVRAEMRSMISAVSGLPISNSMPA